MTANHLFIGRGGTGGSILRYLHDRIETEDWELQDLPFPRSCRMEEVVKQTLLVFATR